MGFYLYTFVQNSRNMNFHIIAPYDCQNAIRSAITRWNRKKHPQGFDDLELIGIHSTSTRRILWGLPHYFKNVITQIRTSKYEDYFTL